MLTPDQMQALQDALTSLADPVTAFIVKDVIRRITEAGKITRTAEYQLKQAIWLKKSKSDIKALIRDKNLPKEVSELFTKAVETAANQMGIIKPLEEDEELQNILSAAVKLAEDDFTNITQTLGMVDPYGNALPLQKAYRSCTDYAFKNVLSGAQSYQQACYEATKNLISQGVQVVDYESGVHTSVEAAVRRNIFGGMGLMVEQIQDHWHDEMNATGWELSAHEACAVDHEPYQGRQYTNEEYEKLNGTAEHPGILQRRIGTLNCKHIAFPVMIGIQKPMYSEEELQAMKDRNQKGITFEGKHYTLYEATQMQRTLERAIRAQRRKIAALEELPDQEDKLQAARIRYTVLQQKYKEFSSAAGLKTQDARTLTVGFGPKQESEAQRAVIAEKTTNEATISRIQNPIEHKNTDKGKPSAIVHYDVELNKRQEAILQQLTGYDSRQTFAKKLVNLVDLAALTAKTGDEFAMFTKGGERLIIRGNSLSVNITEEEARKLAKMGYRWSGHTHPGVDANCLTASEGDVTILACFPQEFSVILNSIGEYNIFQKP